MKMGLKNYKLVYLDTNALSEFVNNTNDFSKKLLFKFVDGNHLFVTSVFNIMELNKTQKDFKKRIKERLGIIPLGILTNIEQLYEYERQQKYIGKSLIEFAVGIKPLFDVGIDDLFSFFEVGSTKSKENHRNANIDLELLEWKNQRINNNPQWQKAFNLELKETMFKIIGQMSTEVDTSQLNYCYSIQVRSYIRNMFIHNSTQELKQNSIIDSYNVSYLPYVDAYITEKTVGSWLETSKDKFLFIKQKEIYKISDFFEK